MMNPDFIRKSHNLLHSPLVTVLLLSSVKAVSASSPTGHSPSLGLSLVLPSKLCPMNPLSLKAYSIPFCDISQQLVERKISKFWGFLEGESQLHHLTLCSPLGSLISQTLCRFSCVSSLQDKSCLGGEVKGREWVGVVRF